MIIVSGVYLRDCRVATLLVRQRRNSGFWIPAFAGMTSRKGE
ncbi:hypothetical protein ACFLYQ_04220 [Chloroflexota bacterium]